MAKIYGYARVSTVQQDLQGQIDAMKKAGLTEEVIHCEKMSGKNMDDRAVLKAIIASLEPGDTIMVHKLDRLGRSVSEVTRLIDDLLHEGKHVMVLDANIDTRNDEGMSGIMTKALITLLGLMAEMERVFILERTKGGRERAMAAGVKFGRKPVKKEIYEMAVDDYLTGHYTVPLLLKKYGNEITEATFYRRLKKRRESDKLKSEA